VSGAFPEVGVTVSQLPPEVVAGTAEMVVSTALFTEATTDCVGELPEFVATEKERLAGAAVNPPGFEAAAMLNVTFRVAAVPPAGVTVTVPV
jgi:hypothetical protein